MILFGNILQDETADMKLIQLTLDTLLNLTTDDGDNDERMLLIMIFPFFFQCLYVFCRTISCITRYYRSINRY